jgi:hypothetical protein
MKADFVLNKSIVLCYSPKLLTINSPQSYFLCTINLNLVFILRPYRPPRSHWTHQLSRQSYVHKGHVPRAACPSGWYEEPVTIIVRRIHLNVHFVSDYITLGSHFGWHCTIATSLLDFITIFAEETQSECLIGTISLPLWNLKSTKCAF